MTADHHRGLPSKGSNEGATTNKFLSAVVNQLPSSQERQGDETLDRARQLTVEFGHVISENDRRVLEERTTQ